MRQIAKQIHGLVNQHWDHNQCGQQCHADKNRLKMKIVANMRGNFNFSCKKWIGHSNKYANTMAINSGAKISLKK